jgi:hypothetical protein
LRAKEDGKLSEAEKGILDWLEANKWLYIECIDFSQLVELLATFHFSYSGWWDWILHPLQLYIIWNQCSSK